MAKNNEILNIENTPLLEKTKEEFSSSLNKELFIFSSAFLENQNSYTASQIFKYADLIINNILKTLSSKNITKKDISKISISNKGVLKIITNKKTLNFNLDQDYEKFEKNSDKSLLIGTNKDIEKIKRKQNLDIVKTREKTSNILDAMDYIFTQNEKEWFDELNDEDIVDTEIFGKELKGKNLKYLQKLFKENFDKLNNYPKENLSKQHIKDLFYQERRYFIMAMGIGDKYEGGASYLKETESNFEKLTNDLVNFAGSNRELLIQLQEFHKKIDDNNYQSTTVEKSYYRTISTLHYKIFNKLMKNKNINDKDLVFFAKIVTGKDSDIDDNLRDPELAQKILITIFQRKNGIIDKLDKSGKINIDDAEIINKNPKSVIDNLRNSFYKKYGKDSKHLKLFNKKLKYAGYKDVLNIPENKEYKDLNFYQKTKLSVLYRVEKKMKEGKSFLEIAEESGSKALSLENPIVKQQYILQDFAGLFNLVAKDYIQETAENIDEVFNENESIGEWFMGKDSSDIGLTGIEAEAFDLFQDINGAGLFDLSDTNISRLKSAGKMAGVIALSVAVPYMIIPAITGSAMGVVSAGATAGAMSSISGWAINPHGYDTIEEAALDLSTDLALGIASGTAGGKWLTSSNASIKKQAAIMAVDLTFLGLVPEAARMKWINGIYHNKPILIDDEK